MCNDFDSVFSQSLLRWWQLFWNISDKKKLWDVGTKYFRTTTQKGKTGEVLSMMEIEFLNHNEEKEKCSNSP